MIVGKPSLDEVAWQAGDYTTGSRGRPRNEEERDRTAKRRDIVAKLLGGKPRPICMNCAKTLEPQFGWGKTALEFKGWGHLGRAHFHSGRCAMIWAEREAGARDRK